jgi:preprotein translocase subunit SecF
MKIVKNRKIFFGISALTVTLSILVLLLFGLKLSIDFAGGDIFEISFDEKVSKEQLQEDLKSKTPDTFSLRETQVKGKEEAYILRTSSLSEVEREKLFKALDTIGAKVERFASVGPIIGSELKKKAQIAIVLTILAIILFIAWAFREVSKPVSSWKYGLVAILALLHDILIPVAAFALLGYFFAAEIDTLFIMALLAILGYSVNDTIVIFDRVRERLKRNQEKKIKEEFEETVEKALAQTITRSINTSLTTILVLLALFALGADSTKYFALTLLVGVLAGTYSSIFLAAPILVEIAKISKKS